MAADQTIPFPTLVTTVKTNGLEAKVNTLTLVPKRGAAIVNENVQESVDAVHVIGPSTGDVVTERVDIDQSMVDDSSESAMSIWEDDDMISSLSHRRAKGVDALKEKGYSSIQEILDPHTDKTGIYRYVDASVPLTTPYRMICVDPGRIELVTCVSKNILPGDTSVVFRDVDNPGIYKGAYSTFEYQKGSKLLSYYQWEQMQRNGNPDYNAWILSMNNLSLQTPFGAKAYIDAYYASIATRSNELLRHERRLRRFRRSNARKLTLTEIAKFVVYGDVLDHSTPTSPRAKKALKRKNDRAISRAKKEGVKRFVAFGDAQFGVGKQGPYPKKDLIREIAKLCPVLMISEWGTSVNCHKCHRRIKKFEGRKVICGNIGCDYEGDRDENAGGNMGQGAVNRMQGLPHPPHLTRSVRNTDDD